MAATVLLIALVPLAWIWLRRRGADRRVRLAALTALTLFLTFDLVVFGAFTRLSDSGLGCPDWPGCYAQASPIGARADIHEAQTALPSGPVTWSKAWIEMIHRYLAATVGLLIVVTVVATWLERRHTPISPWWPTATLVWVVVQGLFGKYTVTLKLYPAIVTLHLLGGLVLLVLLARQREAYRPRPLALPAALRAGVAMALALLWVQIALGGWVSTNYAVLACSGFPLCNGSVWPPADFSAGFTLLRGLGVDAAGGPLSLDALVAIHLAHRGFAVVAAMALAGLAWALLRRGDAATRRWGRLLALLLAAQLITGLSNVVLDWPLPAALIHTAGAAALVLLLTLLWLRSGARAATRA
ncbi:MAG: COX15/CtaA family protein [Burkholderiales bacterium]|nr:COX15/CtaA family protein [Burkholderiales bacterium]